MTDPVEKTRRSYQQVAQDYEVQTAVTPPEFEAFRDRFAAAASGPVADLGCGPGQHAQALRAAGLDVLGVDLSTAMLALAARRGVPVVQGDLRRLPLRHRAFGALWSSASLLHVPIEDVDATLAGWRALLRPGGLLGLSTSLGGEQGWELVPYATPQPTEQPLSRWFVHHDEADLLSRLTTAGFDVEHHEVRVTKRTWLMVLATT
jgi:SAM-dependent methyltransferase